MLIHKKKKVKPSLFFYLLLPPIEFSFSSAPNASSSAALRAAAKSDSELFKPSCVVTGSFTSSTNTTPVSTLALAAKV